MRDSSEGDRETEINAAPSSWGSSLDACSSCLSGTRSVCVCECASASVCLLISHTHPETAIVVLTSLTLLSLTCLPHNCCLSHSRFPLMMLSLRSYAAGMLDCGLDSLVVSLQIAMPTDLHGRRASFATTTCLHDLPARRDESSYETTRKKEEKETRE